MIFTLGLGGLGTASTAPTGEEEPPIEEGTTFNKRYWKFGNFATVTPGNPLDITELRLMDGATQVSGPGTTTTSTPLDPTIGVTSDLVDSDLETNVYYNSFDIDGLEISYDLGAAFDVNGVVVGASNSGTEGVGESFLADFDVYYSDDGVTYTLATSYSGVEFPGFNTATPYLPFV